MLCVHIVVRRKLDTSEEKEKQQIAISETCVCLNIREISLVLCIMCPLLYADIFIQIQSQIDIVMVYVIQ